MDRVRKFVRMNDQQHRASGHEHENDVLEELNNILRFSSAPKPAPEPVRLPREGQTGREATLALNLIQRASEVMGQTEERASEIESRAIALAERAAGKLKDAETRIVQAEQRAREAEARLAACDAQLRDAEQRAEAARRDGREAELRLDGAEKRAREAEQRMLAAEQQAKDASEWLARLNASIRETFASRITSTGSSDLRRTA